MIGSAVFLNAQDNEHHLFQLWTSDVPLQQNLWPQCLIESQLHELYWYSTKFSWYTLRFKVTHPLHPPPLPKYEILWKLKVMEWHRKSKLNKVVWPWPSLNDLGRGSWNSFTDNKLSPVIKTTPFTTVTCGQTD